MTNTLQAIWPLFALIIGGYLLSRRGFLGEGFWPGAERLNYFILFPALLFHSLVKAPLNNPALLRLGAAVLLCLGLAWCGLLLWRRTHDDYPSARFGALTQGLLRFNTYLGLATVGSLFGKAGLAQASLMLALMVPAVNLLSVWALTAERGMSLRALALPIIKNPLILACLTGALANLAGLDLAGGSDKLLTLLATASLPLGLLCIGAALKPRELSGETGTVAWNTGLRLLAMPLLAYIISLLFSLPIMESTVLVLFFALPTAPTAYILTRQLGGNAHLMAGLITLQTLLAMGTLPVVLALMHEFGQS